MRPSSGGGPVATTDAAGDAAMAATAAAGGTEMAVTVAAGGTAMAVTVAAGDAPLAVSDTAGGGPGSPPDRTYVRRSYRERMGSRFRSFAVAYRETDLWIGVDPASWNESMEAFALGRAVDYRSQLESYGARRPEFLTSFAPIAGDGSATDGSATDGSATDGSATDGSATDGSTTDVAAEGAAAGSAAFAEAPGAVPPIARVMMDAARAAGVGPMAAVAGAVARFVGEDILGRYGCREIIVENGGDIWLAFESPIDIAVFAGGSPLSERVGVSLPPELSPCGVCTSSGTVGPSFSFGRADAAMTICRDAALADAWATAIGNLVATEADIGAAVERVGAQPGIICALVVKNGKMGIKGELPLKVFARGLP